jgi:hypothetical protein
MKHIISLFCFFYFLKTNLFAQDNLVENNQKLFRLAEDTLYRYTGNIVTINLTEFSPELKFSYRCENADVMLKSKNKITIMPYYDRPVMLFVHILNQNNLNDPSNKSFIIGQKKFYVKDVPKPIFYLKYNTAIRTLINNDTLTSLQAEIIVLPPISYLSNYPYDSDYTIDRLTILVKRKNKILLEKEVLNIQKVLLEEIVGNIKLQEGDYIELEVNELQRKNYRGTKFLIENWNNTISLIYHSK